MILSIIGSTCRVHSDVYLRLEVCRYEVLSAHHQERRNWRVMACLLPVNRASVNKSLISLA